MARPLIPFVQNGYYASRNWIPLVKGNGFTTSGGGEQEEVWETASGSIVTFDAIAAPLRQFSVAVEPVQAGSGDPSPDNVRPITGWDSVTVNRTGKNLLRLPVVPYKAVNPYGAVTTFDPADYMWMKAGTYTLSYSCPVANRPLFKLTDRNGNMLADNAYNPSAAFYYSANYKCWIRGSDKPAGNAVETVTIVEDCYVRVLRTYNLDTMVFTNPQFELGSTATAYEPYNGNTYTIQLGETVYGGTLDVVNGKMVVDRKFEPLNNLTSYTGAAIWSFNSGNNCFETNKAVVPGGTVGDETGIISSCYADRAYGYNGSYETETSIIWAHTSGTLRVRDTRFTDVNSWLADVGSQTVCYPLNTPFELTLTPEQISTLQGTNNVWSDAGDVTVEYRVR